MLFLETDNHVKHTNCTPNKQKPTTVSLFLNSNSELKMLKDIMESFIDRGESTLLINKFTNKSSNDQYVHMYIDGFWLNNYQNILDFIRGWDNGEQLQEPISFHMVMWDSSWQEDSTSGAHNRKKPLKTTTTTILLLMKKRMRLMRCFQCISAGSG